ncbi:MAG: hypothetical protein ACLSDO_00755 [Anaerotruncus colihominis]
MILAVAHSARGHIPLQKQRGRGVHQRAALAHRSSRRARTAVGIPADSKAAVSSGGVQPAAS